MVKKDKQEKGISPDDAFADDEDVEYAKPKPKKESKKGKSTEENLEELEEEVEAIEKTMSPEGLPNPPAIKASKPITQLKKGDKIKIDSLTLEVDAQTILIDHGTTKEIAVECFDPKTDKDYEIRYFSDQVERTIEVYELQEIMYFKRPVKKIEW
jgi:hypothetical protein